jgi:hypothetical protein
MTTKAAVNYFKGLKVKIEKGKLVNMITGKSLKVSEIESLSPHNLLTSLGFVESRGSSYYIPGKMREIGWVNPRQFQKYAKTLVELRKQKLHHRATAAKTYAITIQFNWKNVNFERVREDRSSSFATKSNMTGVALEEFILKKAELAAIEYVKARTIPGSADNIIVDNVRIVSKRAISAIDSLKDLPFFESVLCYPNFDLLPTERTGLCGYELLMKNYPKKAKSIESLEAFFDKVRCDGLTVRDLEKFCKTHDISLCACDLSNQVIERFYSKSRHEKALVITIANSHCYEITDEDKRDKILRKTPQSVESVIITNRNREAQKTPVPKKDVFLKSIEAFNARTPESANYYIDVDDLNELYCSFLDKGEVYPTKMVQNDFVEIRYKDSTIYAAKDHKAIRNTAKALGIAYKNHSIPKLARAHFKSICEGDDSACAWRESMPNGTIRTLMKSVAMKTGAFNYCLNGTVPKGHKVAGIDVCKQYTTIAKRGDLFYCDIDDETHVYDGEEEIKYGCFYYVETEQYFPFKGNGIYDYQLVQAGLDYGLITKENIKFYMTTHHDESMDNAVRTFIDAVYKTGQGKELTNCLIGGFNIMKNNVRSNPIIVDNWEEASYYFHLSSESSQTRIQTFKTDKVSREFYLIDSCKEVQRVSNNRLVYTSIVQRANLDTYKLLRNVESCGLRIMQVKTDCVFYTYNPKKGKALKPKSKKEAQHGDYRKEDKIPEKFEVQEHQPRTERVQTDSNTWQENPHHLANEEDFYNWQNILQYNRVFIKGFAGSGKSHMIKQLRQHLEKFGCVAFTHTAANNVDGQTAHSFFGLNIEKCIPEDNVVDAILKRYNGIIIDEINQIPKIIYRVLAALPKTFKIYGFGDFRQEPPVEKLEKFDALESQMFLDLFDGNVINLKKQCRSDKEFANACIQYHDTNDYAYIEEYIPLQTIKSNSFPIPDEINITMTNAMRKRINTQLMRKNAPEEATILKKHKTNADGQDMFMYEGLPVIAIKSHKDKNFYNGEMFLVQSFNTDEVELVFRKLNKQETRDKCINIPMDVFRKCFCPAYAMTTYKMEGATIDMPYSIWEFNHMRIKTRYTALTRTIDSNLVSIFNLPNRIKDEEEMTRLSSYKCRIYKISDGERNYVGSTAKSIEARFEEHKEASIEGRSKFYKYMREIGADKFQTMLEEEFDATDYAHQLDVEEYYIQLYNTVRDGLNTKYR